MQTKYNGLLPVVLLLLAWPAAARAQYAYDIVPLGNYSPAAINNRGQVVGEYYSAQTRQYRAFEYSNGQASDLFPNANYPTGASGINDAELIVGTSQPATGHPTQAFVYNSSTSAVQNIGTGLSSLAYAINQSGVVVGKSQADISSPDHAFRYDTATGTLHDIGQDFGFNNNSTASAINNKGQIAGSFNSAQNHGNAFVYSNGVVQDIGGIPGAVGNQVTGINDSGDVIGYGLIPNNGVHGFLYRNGVLQDISVLTPDSRELFPDGINNAGDIVGQADRGAFLYHNGAVQDLNSLIDPSLGWKLNGAVAISDRGQIIGSGNLGGFILTPRATAVPAPGSALTFGVGTAVLLLAARRRKRPSR